MRQTLEVQEQHVIQKTRIFNDVIQNEGNKPNKKLNRIGTSLKPVYEE